MTRLLAIQQKDIDLTAFTSLREIPSLWETNDIMIFFFHLSGNWNTGTVFLDEDEIRHLRQLKTATFRKRFTLSRTILKCILHTLLGTKTPCDISLRKMPSGELRITPPGSARICLSYTSDMGVIAVADQKIGIDIEHTRQLDLKHCCHFLPIAFSEMPHPEQTLALWTKMEAYWKYADIRMFPGIAMDFNPSTTFQAQYRLNERYFLSIVTGTEPKAITLCSVDNNIPQSFIST